MSEVAAGAPHALRASQSRCLRTFCERVGRMLVGMRWRFTFSLPRTQLTGSVAASCPVLASTAIFPGRIALPVSVAVRICRDDTGMCPVEDSNASFKVRSSAVSRSGRWIAIACVEAAFPRRSEDLDRFMDARRPGFSGEHLNRRAFGSVHDQWVFERVARARGRVCAVRRW
jgi:hypothetical protein